MRKALLIIDVQNEYFTGHLPVTYPAPEKSLSHMLELMRRAQALQIPIIVIQHTARTGETFLYQTQGWQLHPEIAKMPYDYLIEKTKPSSFYATALNDILEQEGISDLVIAGYMTQMCCDTTAREAFHRGYGVEFLSDATGTIDIHNDIGTISSRDLHHATLMAQSLRFSRILSTEKWLAEN